MTSPVSQDGESLAARAVPGSLGFSRSDLVSKLLDLHAAADPEALAAALGDLASANGDDATMTIFLDDGSAVLAAVSAGDAGPPELEDVRLDAEEHDLVAKVLRRGEVAVCAGLEEIIGHSIPGFEPPRSFLCRLELEGEAFGVLLACDDGRPDLELYLRLAEHVSLALARLRALKKSYRFGGIDPTRWMFDREWLQNRLEEEVARAKRYSRPLALLLIRFHNLEALTEEAGERTTQVFLRRVGAAARGHLRNPDILAAYGDNGVAVLLPETDRPSAVIALNRLLARILPVHPTASADIRWEADTRTGIASVPEDGDTPAALLRAAEAALAVEPAPLQETA